MAGVEPFIFEVLVGSSKTIPGKLLYIFSCFKGLRATHLFAYHWTKCIETRTRLRNSWGAIVVIRDLASSQWFIGFIAAFYFPWILILYFLIITYEIACWPFRTAVAIIGYLGVGEILPMLMQKAYEEQCFCCLVNPHFIIITTISNYYLNNEYCKINS